ncbi:MAG: TonB-dependent receptor [Gemmatimonadetes bacterium]|nr:TonB-dependent receptor [Gemmatimonadota bacterium]
MWTPTLLLVATAVQDTATSRRPADTLETLVVRATRAGAAAPTAGTTLQRAAIRREHHGQDVPLALSRLPGITATSDAGGYSGYSYLRLRGIDQTRLTISLDGVPLNDPEDQVLYFSNIPDFMNSVQSVRVHRGVGSSGFGTASFGGSLNFESIAVAATPRFGEAEVTAGSFGTTRASVGGATGLRGAWAGYGRAAIHSTDGYRERSGNEGWSGFGSAGWFGDRDALKLTAFAGRSKTQLAYFAASDVALAANRRVNPMQPGERDDFHQEMVSLRYSRTLAPNLLGSVTGYRNSAAGHYDLSAGTGLLRFGLAHIWYGLFGTTELTTDRWSVVAGGHASQYHRDHTLALPPNTGSGGYANTGFKQEQSAFLKVTHHGGAVDLHGDLEIRRAAFQYRPDPSNTFGRPEIDWVFLNPKVGMTWRASPSVVAHASLGRTSREPTRADLFAGADDVNDGLAAAVLPLDRVRPEEVTDLEVGARVTRPGLELSANAFAMRFRDEIAAIGAITFIGTPLRRNVARSSRTGFEIEGTWRPAASAVIRGNATLLRARIAEYSDESTGRTFRDVPPVLTPGSLLNLSGGWSPGRRSYLEIGLRHVGQSQLANDGNPGFVTPRYTTADLLAEVGLGRFDLKLQVQNLFNAEAYTAGYTDGVDRYLFPLATRAVFLTSAIRIGSR